MPKHNRLVRRTVRCALSAATAALTLVATQTASADVTVSPETVTAVEMSSTDVNRVVCSNGVVNDAFFSQEKGVTVTNNGSSAFVKFLIKRDGVNPDIYASGRAEFYIVCDGAVYTLMATPKKIGAQTIWLAPGASLRKPPHA